jgi:hypothetical protein
MTHGELVNCFHQLSSSERLSVVVGLVCIVGAFRRWKWLVDPPLSWLPFYSQAAIKKKMGTRFLLYFTYFLGIVFLAGGIYREAVLCYQLSVPPPHWVRPSS